MLIVFLWLLSLLTFTIPVFAGEPPTQISPINDSIVSSSTLTWQKPSYQVCSTRDAYRVQVDDNPSFPSSSIYRNTYTKNTYYAPQLTLGTWYWRVMVRDETCDNWSSWSTPWSFTLTAATPSPTPTPTPTPIPTPKPTAKPSLVASPTSTHTPLPTPNISPTANTSVSQLVTSSEGPSFAWARRIADSAYRIASVAGAQTATSEAEVIAENQQQENKFFPWGIGPFFWVGFIFIFAGISSIGYIYLKKKPI